MHPHGRPDDGQTVSRADGRARLLPLRWGAVGLVAVGGLFGAGAREAVGQALPAAAGTFPVAILLINLSGAFLLGLLLEGLVRAGDDSGGRRRARLLGGTGFLGAFTTYSTFAVQADLLVRAGRPATAVAYAAATVLGGVLATSAGIALGALGPWRRGPELPIDPEADPLEAGR